MRTAGLTQSLGLDDAKIVELYQAGQSALKIGKLLGASVSTIMKRLNRAGVEMRPGYKVASYDRTHACQMYRDGASCEKIAAHFNVSVSCVWLYLKEGGVEMRPVTPSFDVAAAIEMYKSCQHVRKVAEAFGMSHSTLCYHLEKAGIARRTCKERAEAKRLPIGEALARQQARAAAMKTERARLKALYASVIPPEEKCCFACKQVLPAAMFTRQFHSPDQLNPSCRDCRAKTRHKWLRRERPHLKNPVERRFMKIRGNYGLTRDGFHALFTFQGGTCSICKTSLVGIEVAEAERKAAGLLRTHVDHDHSTGKVRGLLCNACNTFLGHAKDDPARFLAAIAYLESPPAHKVLI